MNALCACLDAAVAVRSKEAVLGSLIIDLAWREQHGTAQQHSRLHDPVQQARIDFLLLLVYHPVFIENPSV